MKRLLCASLTALTLLVPAATAGAAIQTYDYAVTIAGTADYNRADIDGDVSAQHDISVAFKTTIPSFRFVGDAAEDSRGALGSASITRAMYRITGEGGSIACPDHTLGDVSGGGLDVSHGGDHFTFATRVIDAFQVSATCGSAVPPWTMDFGSDGQEVGIGIFDGAFSMPYSMLGQGEMIFPLKGEVTGTSCPFHHDKTVLCSLTWDAAVTFKRIGEETIEDPPIDEVPLVDDLLVPIVAKAKLAPNAKSAVLPVRCVAACSGTLVAKSAGETLGRKTFAAAAGRTARRRRPAQPSRSGP